MIAKVRKGQDFGKLFSYLYREGVAERHTNPHALGGNVIGNDPQSLAEDFRAFAAVNRRTQAPVFHASLRLPAGEKLTDDQWNQAAVTFLKQMKFIGQHSDGFNSTDVPWVAVRHADDHIHIVACRVRFDASTVNIWQDYKRSHQAVRAVEQQLGLSSPVEKVDPLATVTKGERQSATRRRVIPERSRLQERVIHARDNCDGTRPGFERALAKVGVAFKANQASTGKMNGYSFSLADWTDAQGEQVWVTASQTHKSLRWSQLEKDLDARRRELKAQTPWYKKAAVPQPAPYHRDDKSYQRWLDHERQQQAQRNALKEAIKKAEEAIRKAEWDKRVAERPELGWSLARQAQPYTIQQRVAAAILEEANKTPEERNRPKPHIPPPHHEPGRGRGR